MNGHTPGPWHIRTFDGSKWGIDAPGDLAVAQAMQIRPLSFDHTQGERTANARLIAAAPDLLAACKALVDSPVQLNSTGFPDLDEQLRAARKLAEAAIAKATKP